MKDIKLSIIFKYLRAQYEVSIYLSFDFLFSEEALIETSELERMLEDRMLSRANIKLLKIRQQRENTATTSHHSNFYFIIAISVMSIIYYVLILFYI